MLAFLQQLIFYAHEDGTHCLLFWCSMYENGIEKLNKWSYQCPSPCYSFHYIHRRVAKGYFKLKQSFSTVLLKESAVFQQGVLDKTGCAYVMEDKCSHMTLMQKSWILSLEFDLGNQAKGKSRYIKDAIMLPTINCDIKKAATNVTIDFNLFHKKWRKYLVTLKISYYKIQILSKICILLQDSVTSKRKHIFSRYSY